MAPKRGGSFGSIVEIEITRTSEGLQLLDAQYRDCIQRETWCMGTSAGVDYNLILCRLHSRHHRLQHMYRGKPHRPQQPYARVDLIPQSETKNLASAYLSKNSEFLVRKTWFWIRGPQHCCE
jgi:hypothetical protein